jgi:hypothetical protein
MYVMDAKKMFLSLIPWVLFSVVINRHGANEAAIAALLAAGLGLFFLIKNSQHGSVKIIDGTGVVTFGLLAFAGFSGGTSVDNWIADYGRGTSALVLAAVMLTSALTIPFSEQYARETVAREYWGAPVFRSINRRISAMWGLVLLVMGAGHLLAGAIDPASAPAAGARPVDLVLNWVLPAALILAGISYTTKTAASADPAGSPDVAGPTEPALVANSR